MKKKEAPDSGEEEKEKKKTAGNKKAAKPAKARGKSPRKGSSGIGAFAVSGLVASALVVVAMAAGLGWLQFARHQDLSEQRLATALAQSQAGIAGAVLDDVVDRADALASSDWISSAMATTDAADIAERLSRTVAAGQVHLVPADALLPGTDLSFTARELAELARKGQSPAPVLVPNTPAVIYVARPLAGGGGVLLLEKALGELNQRLSRQDLQDGYMTLRQGDGEVLLERGNKISDGVRVSAAGPYDTSVSLTVPYAETDPALLALFGIIVAGGLLLILVTQGFVFRTVAQAIRKDAALLVHLSKELVSNPSARPRGDFSFQPLALVTASLQKLADAARKASTARVKPQAAEPDDAFASVQVQEEDSAMLVEETAAPAGKALPAHIFRAYDIRGRAGDELDAEAMTLIGQAVGSEAQDAGQQTVIVARDGRKSSPELCEALVNGLIRSGRKVINLGEVPTPVLYYATRVLDTATGVCVTGSHNPPEDNGVKIILNGESLHGDRIQKLHQRIADNDLVSGEGSVSESDVTDRYSREILEDIVLARPLKVVVDCANGVAGKVVPELLQGMECEVVPLYTEIDGNFPNHQPDPGQPENLETLIEKVKQEKADLGIAFDGDADRLGLVTGSGDIIWPDRLMMLFSRDLLSRSPGADILFDVKCSRELSRLISQQGGRPLMCRTGHSLMHSRMLETGAPLGGEMSGHIFFADRWYGFDDAIYAAARLLEILSLESEDADGVFGALKTGVSTPEIMIAAPDDRKFQIIEKLTAAAGDIQDGSVSTLDGLRVDFEDGWGLVRASNTRPALTARFEGRDEAALKRIQEFFREQLKAVESKLQLPF